MSLFAVRRRPASLALVVLVVWLSGCASLGAHYPDIEPGEVTDHEVVRVTLEYEKSDWKDGKRRTYKDSVGVNLINARIINDTIKGIVHSSTYESTLGEVDPPSHDELAIGLGINEGDHFALSMDRVHNLERRETSKALGGLAIGMLAVGALVGTFVLLGGVEALEDAGL